MAKETLATFLAQEPLQGLALKNANFLGFVERLAAYRDAQHDEARHRRELRIMKLEQQFERDRAQITADFRDDLNKANEFFEMNQELTERRVERTLLAGGEVRSAESLASWVRPHVNAAYDAKLRKTKVANAKA